MESATRHDSDPPRKGRHAASWFMWTVLGVVSLLLGWIAPNQYARPIWSHRESSSLSVVSASESRDELVVRKTDASELELMIFSLRNGQLRETVKLKPQLGYRDVIMNEKSILLVGETKLVVVDRATRDILHSYELANASHIADHGQHAVFNDAGRLCIRDLSTNNVVSATIEAPVTFTSLWSPQGTRVAILEKTKITILDVGGSPPRSIAIPEGSRSLWEVWTSDDELAFQRLPPNPQGDVFYNSVRLRDGTLTIGRCEDVVIRVRDEEEGLTRRAAGGHYRRWSNPKPLPSLVSIGNKLFPAIGLQDSWEAWLKRPSILIERMEALLGQPTIRIFLTPYYRYQLSERNEYLINLTHDYSKIDVYSMVPKMSRLSYQTLVSTFAFTSLWMTLWLLRNVIEVLKRGYRTIRGKSRSQ